MPDQKSSLWATCRPVRSPVCAPRSADILVGGFWDFPLPKVIEEHGAGKHCEPADKNVCATPAKHIRSPGLQTSDLAKTADGPLKLTQV
jgi:hypothetical protein